MYIGVLTEGGLIKHVVVKDTIEEAEAAIYSLCAPEDFDQGADDARIFDENNKEIKSLYP